MNIIVHYPTDEKGREELAKRVASVHADATVEYIKKLTCSKEQKSSLIDAIITTKRNEKI
jgi:hypothetical protein